MSDQRTASAHLSLVFACITWGGAYAVGRFGLSEGSAVWLALWRWGPGAVGFAVYMVLRRRDISLVVWRDLPKLTLISLLGIVVYPITLFLAVAQTTASNASLYLAVTPILIVVGSSIIWRERIGLVGYLAVGLGLLGALVLIFRGDVAALVGFQAARSDAWAIISALCWAGYCVSLPLKPAGMGELPLLAAVVVIGAVVLLVFAVLSGTGDILLPTKPSTAWSMIYFAVFPSLLAFLAWNWGTSIVGPSVAAPYNNLVPLLGGALGVIFLSERVESYHVVGGALIVAGLILNSLRRCDVRFQ